MSNISKVSKTKMEITADYQKLSNLNVAFYNQDINTSILQFNVTRNDAPVPLGKTDVECYIVLLHEDGSRIQDNIVIENEEKGVIQYTIPREFLKHTGKVLGQVYIAVKGRDDTAVMKKISFVIKQDLMTAFSAAVKLEYIKTFDDLQTQIKQRADAIEEKIANGEDYVARMIATLDTGKKEIAATVSKANTDINKVATDTNNSVTATADTATKNITSVATKAMADVNKVSTDTTKKITDTSNAAVATVNAKGDAVLKAFTENGQVPKITADTGAPRYDLSSAKDLFAEITTWGNGFFTFYLSAGATNNPTGTKSWLRGRVSTYGKNSDVLSYDKDGSMHVVVCTNGIWGSWDKTALSSDLQVIKGSNTGWLPLPLLNGVTASTPCFYRFYSTNGIYYLSFKGVLKTLSTRDVIIAKLPEDVATKIDRPLTFVGNTSVTANKARFNRWVVGMDGTIKFTASSFGTNGESGAWNPLDVTLTL